MATKSKQEQIKSLLKQLESSKDQSVSRKLRKSLRSLGHKGGLNHPRKKGKKKTKAKKAKTTKKKTKKAKAA